MQDVLKKINPVTKPPAVKKKKKLKESFKLNGIIYYAGEPKAIINDTIVKVGDRIDGAEVLEIAENSVRLHYKDDKIILEME